MTLTLNRLDNYNTLAYIKKAVTTGTEMGMTCLISSVGPLVPFPRQLMAINIKVREERACYFQKQ